MSSRHVADQPDTTLRPAEDEADAALVERFRCGERGAFEALTRRYQRPLYFFLLRYVGDGDEAKELTQRTLVQVFHKMAEFRKASSFRAWLYRIGANYALNHLRDNTRFRRAPEAVCEEARGPSLLEEFMRVQQAQRLRAQVARLPEKQRVTLELRVYEELSFKDIAEILGTNEGTAKVNYHHAVNRLKQWMGETEEKEP